MRCLILSFFFVISGSPALAQTARVRVDVRSEAGPVVDAEVIINGASHKTDATGIVIAIVPAEP